MPLVLEDVAGGIPFRIRRRVKWGETDPAGIVYTPRFLDYVLEAAEAWFEAVVGIDWLRLNMERGMGSPMVHTGIDYHSPLAAGETFDVTVTLEHIGRAAYTLEVAGHKPDGTHCFQAKAVAVIIDRAAMKSIAMPDEFRERMEAYQDACRRHHQQQMEQ